MPLAWSQRAGALFLLAFCSGCRSGAAAAGAGSGADGGGVVASPLVFEVALGLTCGGGADAGTVGVCIAPSQVITFDVQGTPGSVVTLALAGTYADAALTVEQLTLTNSAAQVTLESSSVTAQFNVVATAQVGAIVERAVLPITVATSGFATIEALPVYTGHRGAPEFFATDVPLSTCAELTATPSDAGTAVWTSGPGPSGVAIAVSAPAGERVAVEMRIGHYAFGCADVDPLVPDTTLALPVQIYDVPMALRLTNLKATFSFTPDATASAMWGAIAGAATARIEGGFFASSTPDATALLDAMSDAIGVSAEQTQFAQTRVQEGWDATASSWLAAHPPGLKSRAETWLEDAENSPALGPLVATIGHGTPSGTAPFTVVTFGSLPWMSAGLAQPSPFQWTADANDTVHLSGAIDLSSTPLLAHEADFRASIATPNAPDVPTAIALGIDCTGLASSLVGTGVSYGTCGATCTSTLCATALTTAWKSASGAAAKGADAVHTVITASANATVGDLAEPARVEGGWLGSVSGAGVLVDAGSGDATTAAFAITGSFFAAEPGSIVATPPPLIPVP